MSSPLYQELLYAAGFSELPGGCAGLTSCTVKAVSIERTWLDTFDWRLYAAGLRLSAVSDKGGGWRLQLRDMDSGEACCLAVAKLPVLWDEVPAGVLANRLRPVLGVRALMPRLLSSGTKQLAEVRDTLGKRIARLEVLHETAADGQGIIHAVAIRTARGYESEVKALVCELRAAGGVSGDVLTGLLATCGRRPADYSSKFSLSLQSKLPAEAAVMDILRTLLAAMTRNEAGVCEGVDSEYLHDFRVAVRRSRAALSALGDFLPPAVAAYGRKEMGWLGQITGPARDADVYLLSMTEYSAVLAAGPGADLAGMRGLLMADREAGYQNLRRVLKSRRYRTFVRRWGAALAAPSVSAAVETTPVVEVAADRIRRACRRVHRDGVGLGPEAPDEQLHDLRKHFKKLRYLMEFFAPLFPGKKQAMFIKHLRRVQDQLGIFNDCAVQRVQLAGLARRLTLDGKEKEEIAAALASLEQHLIIRGDAAREAFHRQFKAFAVMASARQVGRLFNPKNKGKLP